MGKPFFINREWNTQRKSMENVDSNQKGTQRRRTIIIPPRGNPEPWKILLFLSKMKTEPCYSMISLNSGGLKTKERFDTAIQFCRNSKADFSILQETHLGSNKYFVILKTNGKGKYISRLALSLEMRYCFWQRLQPLKLVYLYLSKSKIHNFLTSKHK